MVKVVIAVTLPDTPNVCALCGTTEATIWTFIYNKEKEGLVCVDCEAAIHRSGKKLNEVLMEKVGMHT